MYLCVNGTPTRKRIEYQTSILQKQFSQVVRRIGLSSTERQLFPCPVCGTGRGKGGTICKKCGWDPNAVTSRTPLKATISRSFALTLGVITILPLVYMCFFFVLCTLQSLGVVSLSRGSFTILLVMHVSVVLLVWCLIGIYIYHLFKTEHVEPTKKTLWAVVLFLGNVIAMPVFWFHYILKPSEITD